MKTVRIVRGALAALLLSAGIAQAADAPATRAAAKAVEPRLVCMVNDMVMGKPQLPVVVEGKTYFGCCAGCVEALNKDEKARFAKDEVTGRRVDKSKAVILEGEGGRALYFESAATAGRYRKKTLARARASAKS